MNRAYIEAANHHPPDGPAPPIKGEPTEALPGAGGFMEQIRMDTPIVADIDADRKAYETLRARLAFSGWSLHRADATGGSPAYTATRWGRATESMGTLESVAQFADRVGAPA